MYLGGRDADHGIIGEGQVHGAILGIACAQPGQDAGVFGFIIHQRGRAGYEDVGELGPIVVIVVNDDGRLRVFQHIADAFEGFAGLALGLVVHHKIDVLAIKGITERNHVRLARGVSSRQAGNHMVVDETLNGL